jgi:c-di-GMP-binding flagellar brake protein YcgR
MSGQTEREAPVTVRRFPWDPDHLVEGTDALLWPAKTTGDVVGAGPPELPDPAQAWPAVLSWVSLKIVRFELAPPPQPVPEWVLASTSATAGPAYFVVHKAYQVGATVACDPPGELFVMERRDLFRLPVAARVSIETADGTWTTYCVDCSLGGLRVCAPGLLEVGSQVRLHLDLGAGESADLEAVVRHCRGLGEHAIVGLQFQDLEPRAEQRLTHFVGDHQRRLLPRVAAPVPVDYGPYGSHPFREGVATELSPGDVTFVAREAHPPGERLGLQLRVSRHEYRFAATVVSSEPLHDGDDDRSRLVRASLDELNREVQAQFRQAVRELAIDRVTSA